MVGDWAPTAGASPLKRPAFDKKGPGEGSGAGWKHQRRGRRREGAGAAPPRDAEADGSVWALPSREVITATADMEEALGPGQGWMDRGSDGGG